MEQCQLLEKWEGKASTKLPNTKADDAWSLLSDYCSFHLWLPFIHTCRKVAGDEGQPGCVRYCASGVPGAQDFYWANEELVAFDPVGRSYTYKITESNMGFKQYVATLQVLPEEESGGCELRWSFESDPLQLWNKEGFVAYLQTGVEAIAKKLEEALKAAAAAAAAN